jgi:hypothetical protein
MIIVVFAPLVRRYSPHSLAALAYSEGHTLGTALEQLEHLTNLTCPLPFLFRPPPLLFLVIVDCLLVHFKVVGVM